MSLDGAKLITHYHLNTDIPDNVDLSSVASAAALAETVLRRLAQADPPP